MQAEILKIPENKQCCKCKQHKELSYFGKSNRTISGYRYDCKDCCKIVRKIHDERHKEKLKIQHKKWLADNVERIKKYTKAYIRENAEHIRIRERDNYAKDVEKERKDRRDHYARNKERILKKRSDWRKEANFDKAKHALLIFYGIKSRCNKKEILFDLIASDIVIPEFCPALGIKLVRGNSLNGASVDRIDNNKGYTKDNIIVVSRLANMIKTSATPEQILSVGGFYKRLMESKQ